MEISKEMRQIRCEFDKKRKWHRLGDADGVQTYISKSPFYRVTLRHYRTVDKLECLHIQNTIEIDRK